MRVLYDISTLGLGQLYQQSLGGAFRAELHLSEGLAASGECELRFCANHSVVAHHGAMAFLRANPRLAHLPLEGGGPARSAVLRALATTAHRGARRVFGGNVLPAAVRVAARSLDRRLHNREGRGGTAVDVVQTSLAAPFPRGAGAARRLLTVYDLMFLRFPHLYGPEYSQPLAAALRSLGARDHIVTTSRYVRDELAADGPAPAERIHVVPLAADDALFHPCRDPERIAAVRRRYGIPDGPYLLGVNTADRRKNVPHTIHAFARASAASPGALGSLVLAGHRGPGSDLVARTIAAYPALRDRIVVAGYVADEDLAPLYSGARQFVYVSLYEGFGLPPLEAMQCGTPVITADCTAMPEVTGEGGITVPPRDVEALAEAMLALAGDDALRREMSTRALARAGGFSWEASTQALLGAYRRSLEE